MSASVPTAEVIEQIRINNIKTDINHHQGIINFNREKAALLFLDYSKDCKYRTHVGTNNPSCRTGCDHPSSAEDDGIQYKHICITQFCPTLKN